MRLLPERRCGYDCCQPMSRKTLPLFLLLSARLVAADADAVALIYPAKVYECLKNPKAKAANLEVLTDTNPFCLRGDFDADGKADYALQVRAHAKIGAGLLVCMGNGTVILLGSAIGEPTFSDMERDAYLGVNWAVYTKKQVDELRAYRSNVPVPVPTVKGESIAMIWEDGIALVYWDGKRFRWAGSKE